ncbi:MAG: hypothetical protein IKA16_05865 [Oscillospiraceae bacterium]|nr:hypothetical protein [Oscillospiraceae bacterium]
MKKFLYIMPAALICMLYAMLTILAGGVSGFQPIALLYICCPILAAVFLRKGNWWGCLFGIGMGGVLLYNGMTAQPQVFAGFVAGIIFIGYYAAMGLVCAATKKKV